MKIHNFLLSIVFTANLFSSESTSPDLSIQIGSLEKILTTVSSFTMQANLSTTSGGPSSGSSGSTSILNASTTSNEAGQLIVYSTVSCRVNVSFHTAVSSGIDINWNNKDILMIRHTTGGMTSNWLPIYSMGMRASNFQFINNSSGGTSSYDLDYQFLSSDTSRSAGTLQGTVTFTATAI